MKKILLTMLCFAAIIACRHSVETPADTGTGAGTGTGGGSTGGLSNVVCFEADILPIFRSSCAKSGCHDVASSQDGYVLDSYANIVKRGIKPGDANKSDIYEAITDNDPSDRMPQVPNPPLTNAQIDLIKRWINEGAKNTVNCGTACDTSIFTYSQGVRPILDANCVGCHNASLQNGGVNLSTYDGVRTVALNGRILGAISHNPGYTPMPYQSAKLSDCKITQIRKWIQSGALNN